MTIYIIYFLTVAILGTAIFRLQRERNMLTEAQAKTIAHHEAELAAVAITRKTRETARLEQARRVIEGLDHQNDELLHENGRLLADNQRLRDDPAVLLRIIKSYEE